MLALRPNRQAIFIQAVDRTTWATVTMLVVLGAGMVAGLAVGSGPRSVAILVGLTVAVPLLVALTAKVEWGLLALVFMTYTNFSDVMIKHHGAASVIKLFVPLLVLIVIYRWIVHGERPVDVSRAAAILIAFGLLGATAMLYARQVDLTAAVLHLYVKNAAIAIVTVLLMRGLPTLRHVIWTLLVAGILLGTIGVIKFSFGYYDFSFWGFGRAPLRHLAGDVNTYRLSGPIGDPNYFAAFLLFLVPLSFDRLVHEKPWWCRCLAAWCLLVCLVCIYHTASRGAMIALALTVVAAISLFRSRYWWGLLLLAVPGALVAIALLPDAYLARFESITTLIPGIAEASPSPDRAIEGRLAEWMVAWALFMDHPLLGVGLGQYEAYFQDYNLHLGLMPRGEPRQAHSLFFEMAAERGLLGLGAFGLILGYAMRNIVRLRTHLIQAGDGDGAKLVAAFGMALLAHLLALLFLHDAYPRFFWMVLTMALAMPQIVGYAASPARSDTGHVSLAQRADNLRGDDRC